MAWLSFRHIRFQISEEAVIDIAVDEAGHVGPSPLLTLRDFIARSGDFFQGPADQLAVLEQMALSLEHQAPSPFVSEQQQQLFRAANGILRDQGKAPEGVAWLKYPVWAVLYWKLWPAVFCYRLQGESCHVGHLLELNRRYPEQAIELFLNLAHGSGDVHGMVLRAHDTASALKFLFNIFVHLQTKKSWKDTLRLEEPNDALIKRLQMEMAYRLLRMIKVHFLVGFNLSLGHAVQLIEWYCGDRGDDCMIEAIVPRLPEPGSLGPDSHAKLGHLLGLVHRTTNPFDLHDDTYMGVLKLYAYLKEVPGFSGHLTYDILVSDMKKMLGHKFDSMVTHVGGTRHGYYQALQEAALIAFFAEYPDDFVEQLMLVRNEWDRLTVDGEFRDGPPTMVLDSEGEPMTAKELAYWQMFCVFGGTLMPCRGERPVLEIEEVISEAAPSGAVGDSGMESAGGTSPEASSGSASPAEVSSDSDDDVGGPINADGKRTHLGDHYRQGMFGDNKRDKSTHCGESLEHSHGF